MITVNGIRNAFFCAIAFGIVACAATPMPIEKLAVARSSLERAEQAQAAQFAQAELTTARNKYAAAQAAADKHDAEVAARLADQADVDAQLAESTARAKQQQQLVNEMDAGMRDLRDETLRRDDTGAATPASQPATTLPQARGAVATAEADPNVSKYAPTELDRARKLLINAEVAAKKKGAKDKTAAQPAKLSRKPQAFSG